MTQKFASFELLDQQSHILPHAEGRYTLLYPDLTPCDIIEPEFLRACITAEFDLSVRLSNPMVVIEPRKAVKKLTASKHEQTVEILKGLDSRAGRGCVKTSVVLSRDTVADNAHALLMAQRRAGYVADQAEMRRWFKSGSKLTFKKWKARELKLAVRQPLPAPPKAKPTKVASGPSHIRATWVPPSPGTRT
jgi:hypothetical protein